MTTDLVEVLLLLLVIDGPNILQQLITNLA